MSAVMETALNWTEMGLVPDTVIRAGIRCLLEKKRREIHSGDVEYAAESLTRFVAMMNSSPIALNPDVANQQHYELPAKFFELVMGKHLKYSCCYWPNQVGDLTAAEAAALEETAKRAEIEDGMSVLDLGCGWGSLSLWIAQHYPNAAVTAVSNSQEQRNFVQQRAKHLAIKNIDVIVSDMNEFDIDAEFDRVVSIEMFEHMRNYGELFRRIGGWLRTDGKFFMHIFCHRSSPYEYSDKGPGDWMSRHFFTGGIMPSADLPLRFPAHLKIERRWHWSGLHYAKTCNAWLKRMDSNLDEIRRIFVKCYGEDSASIWLQRWRMFFMACAELFDYDDGQEWYVGHYLFEKRRGWRVIDR